jgi:hypothetical protein
MGQRQHQKQRNCELVDIFRTNPQATYPELVEKLESLCNGDTTNHHDETRN